MKPLKFLLLTASLYIKAIQCIPSHQFDQFFPSWNGMIQQMLREKCLEQLEVYKSEQLPEGENVGLSSLVTPIIDCLLSEFPEFRKAELAASAVILGSMPNILQTIGSLTVETALLSLRRPLLAFLVSAGSPAVQVMKSSEFPETLATASAVETSRQPRRVRSKTIFMLPLWTFLAVVIHVGGIIALHLRVRVVPSTSKSMLRHRENGFPSWAPNELVPSGLQPTKRLEWREQNIWHLAISWQLGIGTLIHIIFDTLVLSSLLFFSVVDAVTIVSRYAASAIVCRAVVRIELGGMSQDHDHDAADETYVQAGSKDNDAHRETGIPLAEQNSTGLRDLAHQSQVRHRHTSSCPLPVSMETVLVVGSTGNIGLSAVLGALRSQRKVLAIVRNRDSAIKLLRYVRWGEGITIVEADIMSESGVRGVVDQVKAGKLPAFQHVYAAAGGANGTTPLKDLTTEELLAYRDTIQYLIEQNNPNSTWTLCTGSQGSLAQRPAPAMTQGALFSMATAASRENASTNVRFNEVYLGVRVEVDEVAVQHGTMRSSEFSSVYEEILARPEIRSARVEVLGYEDLRDLRWRRKFQ
ncbi:hypothetical protein HJFPF1_02537 [Paramyrothecium foliicola]|nr:hypothetical protein HJFPF1_02537 [Paramyrothecium foliicola]